MSTFPFEVNVTFVGVFAENHQDATEIIRTELDKQDYDWLLDDVSAVDIDELDF